MPIYEYNCNKCGRMSSHLVLNINNFEPFCKICGSRDVKKLISRVRVRLSEETRLERLADPSTLSGLDENDPKSISKWMKKMGSLAGDDFEGNFDEMVDEAVEEVASSGAGETEDISGASSPAPMSSMEG